MHTALSHEAPRGRNRGTFTRYAANNAEKSTFNTRYVPSAHSGASGSRARPASARSSAALCPRVAAAPRRSVCPLLCGPWLDSRREKRCAQLRGRVSLVGCVFSAEKCLVQRFCDNGTALSNSVCLLCVAPSKRTLSRHQPIEPEAILSRRSFRDEMKPDNANKSYRRSRNWLLCLFLLLSSALAVVYDLNSTLPGLPGCHEHLTASATWSRGNDCHTVGVMTPSFMRSMTS